MNYPMRRIKFYLELFKKKNLSTRDIFEKVSEFLQGYYRGNYNISKATDSITVFEIKDEKMQPVITIVASNDTFFVKNKYNEFYV